MNKFTQTLKYVVSDTISSTVAWSLFYAYRKEYIEKAPVVVDSNFYYGLILVPCFWVGLYLITGSYTNVFRKYRLKEISQTLFISFVGCLFLFFILILDDNVLVYKDYHYSFITLLSLHLGLTIIPRYYLTTKIVKRIHRREFGFPTLIIGGNERASMIYDELMEMKVSPGYKFIGVVSTNGVDKKLTKHNLHYFGKFDNVKEVIREQSIEEVIIAIESSEHQYLSNIINELAECKVRIKIIPDMYDILTGSVKMTSIFGAPLIEINADRMIPLQQFIKRSTDVLVSIFAMVVLAPVYAILAILVRQSSPGPIFFRQERIGLHGRPFQIVKFRTMYQGAEKDGPQLSSEGDSRITPIGKVLRKMRLDEFPQFYNVLVGDMSLVGPRPERQFYIDQIKERAPHYAHLQKIKPGITSWGQVKYGYAENVDEMIQRLKFDIIYLENMSFAIDLKIMFYTIVIIIRGSGK